MLRGGSERTKGGKKTRRSRQQKQTIKNKVVFERCSSHRKSFKGKKQPRAAVSGRARYGIITTDRNQQANPLEQRKGHQFGQVWRCSTRSLQHYTSIPIRPIRPPTASRTTDAAASFFSRTNICRPDGSASRTQTCKCPDDLMGSDMGLMISWPSFSPGSSAKFSAKVLRNVFEVKP